MGNMLRFVADEYEALKKMSSIYLCPTQEVSDLVHSAVLRIIYLDSIGYFERFSYEELKNYFMTVVKNISYNEKGRLARYWDAIGRYKDKLLNTEANNDPQDIICGQMYWKHLLDQVRSIKEPMGEFLIRNVFKEENLKELAKDMNISYETAKKRRQRGRIYLTDIWKEEEE